MFNRIRSEPLQKVPTKDPSITCHVLGTEPLGYDQMNIRQTGLAVSSSEKFSPSPDSIPLLDLHIAYANFHALNWNLSDTGRTIMDGAGKNWLRPDHLSYDLALPTFHNTSRESSVFVNHIKPMTESRYEEWEQSMGSYVFPGNPTGDHRNLLDFDPIDESTYIDSSEIMQEEVPKYFHHQPCISTEKSGLVSAPPLARRAQAQASAQNTLNDQLNDAPYSYLIWQALLAAPGNQLSLRDIYAWIQHNTDKPSRTVGNGWQNSIRYNLSMNTGFEMVQIESCNNFPRRMWRLTDEAKKSGIKSTSRSRNENTHKGFTVPSFSSSFQPNMLEFGKVEMMYGNSFR